MVIYWVRSSGWVKGARNAIIPDIKDVWRPLRCSYRKCLSATRFWRAKPPMSLRELSIRQAGMITLLEDGLVKAAIGQTTVDEVLRTLPRVHKPRPVHELRRIPVVFALFRRARRLHGFSRGCGSRYYSQKRLVLVQLAGEKMSGATDPSSMVRRDPLLAVSQLFWLSGRPGSRGWAAGKITLPRK